MVGKLVGLTVLVAAVGIFVGVAPALAATSIGQTGGNVLCGPDGTYFATSGNVYTVPSGTWRLTSWSTQAGASGGEMAAVVLRAAGGGSYTIVAVSSTQNLTANSLNTFGASITVQGGDILGLWATGPTVCGAFGGSNSYAFTLGGLPSVGTTFTPTSGFTSATLNISATLSPGAGAVIPQMNNVFVCYSTYEQDGGAVFPAAEAKSLLAAGAWLPYAIAGNATDGDNIGAYHLDCNPPSTLKPTGMYIGDGGDIVSADYAKDAVVGYYAIVA